MNDPGCSLEITVSSSFGFRKLKIWDRGVSAVNTGAPDGVLCHMWMIGAFAARYLSRRDLIADRVESILTVLSWPSAYLGFSRYRSDMLPSSFLIGSWPPPSTSVSILQHAPIQPVL